MAPCHRSRKWSATSATTGPSRRTAASCQPIPPRAGCSWLSYGSPPSYVRSMPPTNATRSSITIVFSWWQCISRTQESNSQWIWVPRRKCSTIDRTSPRDGRNTGSGAPAPDQHADGNAFGELPEEIAQRHRFFTARERELRREVPAGQVDVRLDLRELICDQGENSAPSIRTSTRFPVRGGNSPVAQSRPSAPKACSQPALRSAEP